MRLNGTTRSPHRVPRPPLAGKKVGDASPRTDRRCHRRLFGESVAAREREFRPPTDLNVAAPRLGGVGTRWRKSRLGWHGQEFGGHFGSESHRRRARLWSGEQAPVANFARRAEAATIQQRTTATSLAASRASVAARAAADRHFGAGQSNVAVVHHFTRRRMCAGLREFGDFYSTGAISLDGCGSRRRPVAHCSRKLFHEAAALRVLPMRAAHRHGARSGERKQESALAGRGHRSRLDFRCFPLNRPARAGNFRLIRRV
jgi:hypothetical protein